MTKNPGMNGQLRDWVIAKSNPLSVAHVGLSAMAAVVSYLIARRLRLPEACWAPMSTLIVMQSTLSAALPIAVQYVAGTAGRSSRWCHHTSQISFAREASGRSVQPIAVRCAAGGKKRFSQCQHYSRDRDAGAAFYQRSVSRASPIL